MAGARFVARRNAVPTLERIVEPKLEQAADAIAGAIPGNVPVVHGGAIATYRPAVVAAGRSRRVYPGSPLWHLLEYGTAFSPAYRPVEQTVRGLGLRWEAH